MQTLILDPFLAQSQLKMRIATSRLAGNNLGIAKWIFMFDFVVYIYSSSYTVSIFLVF
jgi:hypothetical protein